ncbi:ketoacyl-ACP synthase III [Pedobacter frigiditerrae]|uniref:ketoacyl-ACP synthase III n=1 Tax=Pedobacter frigiditerrae TaxID=2530452 RepID=UPI00292D534A|nr:ketoacyl-ACP synthase III [Pedobacter frigiditerrae]
MTKAYIKAVSYYLPTEVLSNEIINSEFPEWSVDKISSKTGIFNRHIAANDEFSLDMAIKASNNLFNEHRIKPSSIDFILLCTQSPDYLLPTTACILQDRLGIPTSAGALDFNLGCSGYVYGLGLAKGLIYAGLAKNVLLVTSETYSKFIHPKDKSNKTIFGDAASASLISAADGFAEILDFELGTDGRGAENLMVKNGGMRYTKSASGGGDKIDDFGNIINENNLYMNGTEIFNFTSAAVPLLIDAVLAKNNILKEDISLFIFHQANKYMLNHLRKKAKIEEDKFYYFLENCGNTVSSTIPIALANAWQNKEIKDKVLLAGFGVGYSWGGCIIKIIKE